MIRTFFALCAILICTSISSSADTEALLEITPINVSHIEEIARIGDGWLNEVNWSPTGETIATAGSLGIWLYDANNLSVSPRLYDGHSGIVTDVIFDPSGTILASAGQDNQVVLWDAETGIIRHVFDGQPSLRFNSDGTVIAFQSMSSQKDVVLHSVESGELLATLSGNHLSQFLWPLAFSSDDRLLVGVYRSYRWPDANIVKVWDLTTGSTVFETPVGEFATEFAEFGPDQTLITYDFDGLAREWDIESGNLLSAKKGDSPVEIDDSLILDLRNQHTGREDTYPPPYNFSPDRNRIAVISDQLEIWNIETGLLQRSDGFFFEPNLEIAVHEASNSLATITASHLVLWRLNRVDDPLFITSIPLENGYATDVQFTNSGGMLLHDKTSRVLIYMEDPHHDTDATWTHTLNSDLSSSVTSLSDRVLVVTLDSEQGTYRFDELAIETGEMMNSTVSQPFLAGFDRLDSNLFTVEVHPQVGLIATGSSVTRLWDMETKEELAALFDYQWLEGFWPTDALVFDQSGELLLASVWEYGAGIIVWDTMIGTATYADVQNDITTDTGSRLLDIDHGIEHRRAAFLVQDQMLVSSASGDYDAIIWNTSNWMSVKHLIGHRASVTDVAVIRDEVIVTSSSDGTVRLWGIPSSEE